jgi:CspA family cold shock protein
MPQRNFPGGRGDWRAAAEPPVGPLRGKGADLTGHIKHVRHDRGYGFIRSEDGRDVFFHRSGVVGEFADMREGQAVSYGVQPGRRGPEAVRIRPLDRAVPAGEGVGTEEEQTEAEAAETPEVAEVAAQEERIDDLRAQLAAHDEAIEALEVEIAGLRARIEALEAMPAPAASLPAPSPTVEETPEAAEPEPEPAATPKRKPRTATRRRTAKKEAPEEG